MLVRFLLVLILSVCAESQLNAETYGDFEVGVLKGKLVVQWLEPDIFLFLPDRTTPLFFTRKNGQTVQPGRMLTDGGSIPRPLRVFRNYSPWGYAPAFVVHDWIFHIKHCKLLNYASFDLTSAGHTMAEIIKTMMESGKVEKDEFTVFAMYTAVTSRVAQRYWDDDSQDKCGDIPLGFDKVPLQEFTIEFP